MKTENNPYSHFCANCQRQIGENDREFWFDAYDTNPTLKTFCSIECISEYYNVGIVEVEDILEKLGEEEIDNES